MLKAADAFDTETTWQNEMGRNDFTYFKIIWWGWTYPSILLDDVSRDIIA